MMGWRMAIRTAVIQAMHAPRSISMRSPRSPIRPSPVRRAPLIPTLNHRIGLLSPSVSARASCRLYRIPHRRLASPRLCREASLQPRRTRTFLRRLRHPSRCRSTQVFLLSSRFPTDMLRLVLTPRRSTALLPHRMRLTQFPDSMRTRSRTSMRRSTRMFDMPPRQPLYNRTLRRQNNSLLRPKIASASSVRLNLRIHTDIAMNRSL